MLKTYEIKKNANGRPMQGDPYFFDLRSNILISKRTKALSEIIGSILKGVSGMDSALNINDSINKAPVAYNYGKIVSFNKKVFDLTILELNAMFQNIIGQKNRPLAGRTYSQAFGRKKYIDFLIRNIAAAANGEQEFDRRHYVSLNHSLYELYVSSPKKGYFTAFFRDVEDDNIYAEFLKNIKVFREILLECFLSKAVLLNIGLPFNSLGNLHMVASADIARDMGLFSLKKDYLKSLIMFKVDAGKIKPRRPASNRKLNVYSIINI